MVRRKRRLNILEIDILYTCHHFLGFKFLVRNEEKNEIPCQGTRKIQGIS